MWYAYRLYDQKEWTKMKEFDSLNEYKEYIEKKNISHSICLNKPMDLRGRAASEWKGLEYDSSGNWIHS